MSEPFLSSGACCREDCTKGGVVWFPAARRLACRAWAAPPPPPPPTGVRVRVKLGGSLVIPDNDSHGPLHSPPHIPTAAERTQAGLQLGGSRAGRRRGLQLTAQPLARPWRGGPDHGGTGPRAQSQVEAAEHRPPLLPSSACDSLITLYKIYFLLFSQKKHCILIFSSFIEI